MTPSSHVLGEPPLKFSLGNSGYPKLREIKSGGNLTLRHGIIGMRHHMKGNIKWGLDNICSPLSKCRIIFQACRCLAFEGRMGRSLVSTSLPFCDVLNLDWEDFILLCQPPSYGSSCNSDEVIELTCTRHNCMSSHHVFNWHT